MTCTIIIFGSDLFVLADFGYDSIVGGIDQLIPTNSFYLFVAMNCAVTKLKKDYPQTTSPKHRRVASSKSLPTHCARAPTQCSSHNLRQLRTTSRRRVSPRVPRAPRNLIHCAARWAPRTKVSPSHARHRPRRPLRPALQCGPRALYSCHLTPQVTLRPRAQRRRN